jgi:hypothetical protein
MHILVELGQEGRVCFQVKHGGTWSDVVCCGNRLKRYLMSVPEYLATFHQPTLYNHTTRAIINSQDQFRITVVMQLHIVLSHGHQKAGSCSR